MHKLRLAIIPIALVLVLSLISKAESGDARKPLEHVSVPLTFSTFGDIKQSKKKYVGLTYTERGGYILLRDPEGYLYGRINLRTGAIMINGNGIVIQGYCRPNMDGPGIMLDTVGIESIVIGTTNQRED